MPGQDFNQASAFIAAIAGDPAVAIIDWRALHDTDKSDKGHARRGTLSEWWLWLCQMNDAGYGIFCTIAMMDGNGRELQNVSYLRAHYTDLDNSSALQNYDRVKQAYPPATFGVWSSPNKRHAYWSVVPYSGNDRFQLVQRKLRQVFDGDRRVIDAARVMRVPGLWHLKDPANPHMVVCEALPGYGQPTTVEALEAALAGVNVIDGGVGTRHELGDPDLAAPSLDWLQRAMDLCDPNELDRGEWIAMTSAIKQAGWSLTDDTALFNMWSAWCARYGANDIGENNKQWNSIRNTELGWSSILHRVPSLKATMLFGQSQPIPVPQSVPGEQPSPTPPMPEPPPLDCSGEFLTHLEQQEWFKGCVYIINLGTIFTGSRSLNSSQFNAAYGGKKFVIDGQGKTTNEAWQAATRSTLWTIPKVDHTRFLPFDPFGKIITDELGRDGVNIYRPANIKREQGDVTPFLNHIAALLPDASDQKILLDYLAHNAKYPGVKIPWAPVIQSTEGAGKGIMKLIMRHVMGKPYFYTPKASELAQSGAKFNAWLRNRLFILVDEIKVDERRELIEVLKPLISEEDTEVQGKGVDQDLEDNFSNWLFFTNWKDAIPINKNARRFAIMYSVLQTIDDLLARGMDENYFNAMYAWCKGEIGYPHGAAIVADYLLNYPIERGAIPMRAPLTSSTQAAITISRSPVERMILEAVEDGLPGFRGGWVSATMVAKRIKATGTVRGGVMAPNTIAAILEGMGYNALGRAPRAFPQEDFETRPYLFYFGGRGDVGAYGRAQGWE